MPSSSFPSVADMTQGQLLLHFGATCRRHGADGVRAFALAGRIPIETLRAALLAYDEAMKAMDYSAAETALVTVLAGVLVPPEAASSVSGVSDGDPR